MCSSRRAQHYATQRSCLARRPRFGRRHPGDHLDAANLQGSYRSDCRRAGSAPRRDAGEKCLAGREAPAGQILPLWARHNRAQDVANCAPGRLVAAAVARRGGALLLEALPAVDRLVVARLEGDFRLLAACRANSRVHLARSRGVTTARVTTTGVATARITTRGTAAIVAAGGALRLALGTAARATLGCGVAALLIERLLSGRKNELLAAIATGNRLIHFAETSLAVVSHGPTKYERKTNGFGEMARQDSLICGSKRRPQRRYRLVGLILPQDERKEECHHNSWPMPYNPISDIQHLTSEQRDEGEESDDRA
jgi:hypothetical protein